MDDRFATVEFSSRAMDMLDVRWTGEGVPMIGPTGADVTQVLTGVCQGDCSSATELMAQVYDELRSLARAQLRRRAQGHTLQATALVHEAYMRLVGGTPIEWESRAHFFAVAARAMRQILANHARAKRAGKRSADGTRVTLSDVFEPGCGNEYDLLAVHDALKKLKILDARQCEVVELRFFSGMTYREIGHVLGVSVATVERDWKMARAWLSAELRRGEIH